MVGSLITEERYSVRISEETLYWGSVETGVEKSNILTATKLRRAKVLVVRIGPLTKKGEEARTSTFEMKCLRKISRYHGLRGRQRGGCWRLLE